ncbi:MAG: hypothetical protein ACK4K9_06855 [Bacteroidia bacterium]
MKFFNIFISIIGFFAIVFIVSLFFPRTYHIKSSVIIGKPVSYTFDYLNTITNWNDWSPWNKDLDSTLTSFYSPVKKGNGATQYFNGKNLGHGSFIIRNSIKDSLISYSFKLHFKEADFISGATFYFEPSENNTLLHWVDTGDVGYNPLLRFMLPSKINSTKESFNEGLQMIKKAAETK